MRFRYIGTRSARGTTHLAAIACAISLVVGLAEAQEEGPVEKINEAAATASISVTPLRGGISAVMGSGGNITVLNGQQGKLLIDAGIAVSRPRVSAALLSISDTPVKYVIDTHYHWDHTDGNEWLHGQGATILAQRNTLKRVSAATRVDDWNFTFPVYGSGGRPTILFDTDKTLKFEGTTIELKYYGLAHTDSDISAYFVEPDVLSTGDTFWNGVYPFIDNENGGSIDGMIRAAEANVQRAGEKTLVVPGHGPVGRRADLIAFRDMLVAIRANVAALKSKGMSIEQVIAARPTADFDAKWGGYVLDGPFFTRIVYDGLRDTSVTSASASAGTDNRLADQVARVSQICQAVIGLNPSEPPVSGLHPGTLHLDPVVSHFQGCIASLLDSVQRVNVERQAQQADADCRARGIPSGGSQLAVCILQSSNLTASRPIAKLASSAPSDNAAVAEMTHIGSFNYASPNETLRREELACARLGLSPLGRDYADCVTRLEATFFAIDNPLD